MMAGSRADPLANRQLIALDEAITLTYYEPLLDPVRAVALFDMLYRELPWQQPRIRLFGATHSVPRLQSWHGEPEARYRYSGMELLPRGWNAGLNELRRQVGEIAGQRFNSVLANLYRDGNDRMGWHADDEPELGPAPVVASVSLGAGRDFALRPKGSTRTGLSVHLAHNSLLIMPSGTQARWQHSLPRRARVRQPRINLTFRLVETGNHPAVSQSKQR